MVGVDVAIDRADLGAEHALERDRERVDDGDVEAALSGGGRDLGADPAGADHDDRAAAVQPLTQKVGVLDGAQVQHAVERCAGDGKAARLGAGGEQQPVVAQPFAIVERHLADRCIEAHGGATEAELDVVGGVEALVVDVDLLAPDLPAQVVLGQRRPLVGALGLGADQHHAPVEALRAQRLGGLRTGETRADDHECLVTVMGCLRGHGMDGGAGAVLRRSDVFEVIYGLAPPAGDLLPIAVDAGRLGSSRPRDARSHPLPVVRSTPRIGSCFTTRSQKRRRPSGRACRAIATAGPSRRRLCPIAHRDSQRHSTDVESLRWLRALSGTGRVREDAAERLHALLLRAARFEVARRRSALGDGRQGELNDLATQAADDALVTILRKLHTYRGDSRFTTWAYKFALLEAAAKVRRRAWHGREIPLEADAWARLVDDRPASPEVQAETFELIDAVRDAIAEVLTPHQRAVLVALTLNDVPIDVLAERRSTTRGALYKTLHDARQKLRTRLAKDGLAIEPSHQGRAT